jgi:hypothetical protein
VDAARAAGCLIEHEVDNGGFASVSAYITDKEMAADLLRRAVERKEAEDKKRTEEEAAWRSRNGQIGGGTPEEQEDVRRARREQAKADAAAARKFNEELGRNLLNRRGNCLGTGEGGLLAGCTGRNFVVRRPDRPTAGSDHRIPELLQLQLGDPGPGDLPSQDECR